MALPDHVHTRVREHTRTHTHTHTYAHTLNRHSRNQLLTISEQSNQTSGQQDRRRRFYHLTFHHHKKEGRCVGGKWVAHVSCRALVTEIQTFSWQVFWEWGEGESTSFSSTLSSSLHRSKSLFEPILSLFSIF